ncbi:dihydropteridine reductase-like protein [Thamnocephalis sphaerospora]|uniref:Dihydropteridine reductase n=1 Tax=Thamnocephalis sphaerospora TaxID=78915 RepID=A0A4P9XR58_9FUNG|nr:dihydropteridine reductase-like protein [Thamnocephalis sphaerospora]|eukprot:RKP07991.1 dihydropteridine reductase-like protein [Thamnocephalis sphaerospora]
MSTQQKVIVYGGAGALGDALVRYFKTKGWSTVSVDVRANGEADQNIEVSVDTGLAQQTEQVEAAVRGVLSGSKVDAVLCVAGGWAGGNVSSATGLANAELMWKQSVNSSLIAAHVASKHLKDNGLLVFTGALAAKSGTAGMIGYGTAKAAVHHLTTSLADPNSGLPTGARVAAILPITLDTPGNRAGSPNADYSSWTPLDVVAEKLYAWATEAESFNNGALISIITKNGSTTFE